jgi:sugar lactone lactonase YvrE
MRILALAALVLGLLLTSFHPAVAAQAPAVGPATLFADTIDGPEGLAFLKDGSMVVGSATGRVLRFLPDGSRTILAELGEPLAGLTVMRDGRLLVASLPGQRVWVVEPTTGFASVFASGIGGPNAIVQTRRGRIYVSASTANTIEEITTGVPVTRSSAVSFPNGLAIGGDRELYVAETLNSRILRFPIGADGSLGTPVIHGTGVGLADGIAFDRRGNLLATGSDTLWLVPRGGGAAVVLSADPLINWPANFAFGGGRGFSRRDLYLPNFGFPLGSGTTIIRMPYSQRGAPLIR